METIGEVLVADCDPAIRHLLEVVVRMMPRRAVPAEDGQSVLALLGDHAFDAVLLDPFFPDEDEVPILEQISREHPDLLPRVVILTTAPPAIWRHHPWMAGVGAVLQKPFALDELQHVLRECCSVARPA